MNQICRRILTIQEIRDLFAYSKIIIINPKSEMRLNSDMASSIRNQTYRLLRTVDLSIRCQQTHTRTQKHLGFLIYMTQKKEKQQTKNNYYDKNAEI